MTTPSGGNGQFVKCVHSEDCYARARELCNGNYEIVDSTSRAAGRELTIECGRGRSSSGVTREGATGSSDTRLLDDVTAPTSAAGFNFGDTVDATTTACKNAGHDWKGGGARYRCSGTVVDTGLGASARLAFCKEALCRIDVVSPPPPDQATLQPRLEKVVSALTERYGQPTRREVVLPQSCDGRNLVRCLEDRRAHFLYQWSWKERRTVTLTLGTKKPEDWHPEEPRTGAQVLATKTLRIRYDEGHTPDPAKNAVATEPGTDSSEHEIGGL